MEPITGRLCSLEAASAFDKSPGDAYEIILIDNGSTHNCDEDELRRLLPGLVVHRMQNAMVSPVPAINFGLAVASGDLVGVCLDGARMGPGPMARCMAGDSDRMVCGNSGAML